MADKARKLTDQELNKLEREIYELYATASNEISAEWRKYMASHKKTLDQAYNELQEAKKSGNRDAIAEANEKYERTVKNVTLNDIRYKAMLNETTAKLANINQIALDYVNGDMPKIYTLNYNAFGDEKIDGYTFTLVNERAIAELVLSNEIRLPKKKINVPKDEAWNAKNINSQLMQGILQGESVAKIAKRLQNVTNMNKNSAIRNARTMVTGAENQGRQDSFKKAQSDGVLMKRRWVATHDERTRAWHSDLDGVEVDVDEPFQNDFGDIMFPGDPTADAANVYNCRCSIRAVVKGFKWNKAEDQVEEVHIPVTPTNAQELSEKWGIPIEGLQGDVIKNMDDALTFMKNEFNVDPKEYITEIDNKNPNRLRNYQAYWFEMDRAIHVHKDYIGKTLSLDADVCAHEFTHALNGYLSMLETKNHNPYHAEEIANSIMSKVFAENGYSLNNRTKLPSKEDVAHTITKYGSTNSLEALAESALRVYNAEVEGRNIKYDMPKNIFNEIKRRLNDDLNR